MKTLASQMGELGIKRQFQTVYVFITTQVLSGT